MKVSARNQIKGKIVSIKEDSVSAYVVLDIGGGNKMSATISLDAVHELGLKVGKEAVALVKSSAVMIGVE